MTSSLASLWRIFFLRNSSPFEHLPRMGCWAQDRCVWSKDDRLSGTGLRGLAAPLTGTEQYRIVLSLEDDWGQKEPIAIKQLILDWFIFSFFFPFILTGVGRLHYAFPNPEPVLNIILIRFIQRPPTVPSGNEVTVYVVMPDFVQWRAGIQPDKTHERVQA